MVRAKEKKKKRLEDIVPSKNGDKPRSHKGRLIEEGARPPHTRPGLDGAIENVRVFLATSVTTGSIQAEESMASLQRRRSFKWAFRCRMGSRGLVSLVESPFYMEKHPFICC